MTKKNKGYIIYEKLTINDLKESLEKQSTTVEHYRKEMELMRPAAEAKASLNRASSQMR